MEHIETNELRPYNTGFDDNDTTIATIVLTQEDSPLVQEDLANIDYLNEFDNIIPEVDVPTQVRSDDEDSFLGVFKNFSLLQANESRAELAKITKTFGRKWHAFFFNQEPKVYSFTGIFLDSKNYNYYKDFMKAYDKYLAGSKCLKLNYKMYLSYENKIIDGLMLGINTTNNSSDMHHKGFSFQLLVFDDSDFEV